MRLIDADALSKPNYAEDDNVTGFGMTYDEMDGYNDGIDVVWGRIRRAPTVDAVEVVRCKDCRHMTIECGLRFCNAWERFNGAGDEGFCNYGERRNNG